MSNETQGVWIEFAGELAAQAISAFRRAGNDAAADAMDAAINQHARETWQRIKDRANVPTLPPAA